MNPLKLKRGLRNVAIGFFLFLFCNNAVRANVYATDIRMNGSLNAGVTLPGAPVIISYILNDEADGGVSLRILSGTNVIDTFTILGGQSGSHVGFNSILWGGTNQSGVRVEPGIYTVSITAGSMGYDDWTTLAGGSTNFSAAGLTGVDVNRNTNSPFYGRFFVGCAYPSFNILKLNADGSPGDEGEVSAGGLSWGAGAGQYQYFSPWKIAVGENDKVYINDFSGDGVVYAFDETISTNYQLALGESNYPYPDPNLSGLSIIGSGTNAFIWMTDLSVNGSAGILRWQLDVTGCTSTNDTGTVIAPVTDSSPLSWAPYDIAVDKNGFIYTIQLAPNDFSGIVPIMCFPPYEGFPETNTVWTSGTGDPNQVFDYGIAVDPTATYVAVAVHTTGDPEALGDGYFLDLYHATNGQFYTNINGTFGHLYLDVAWDNIGNLYALDLSDQAWRIFSPPGSNQATTLSVPFIQAYDSLTPPTLHNPSLSDTGLNFTLTGQSNVTYFIQQSPDLQNWTSVATNYSPTTIRPLAIPCGDSQDFFRVVVGR